MTEHDRDQDIRSILTDVTELRHEVAIHGAPSSLWRGLLAMLLFLRLGLAFVTVANPGGSLVGNGGDHIALAHQFAVDGQYGLQPNDETTMMSPPAFVVFLAGLELAFGPDLHWVTLVQLLFSGLTSLILLRIGIDLQRARAGLLAAWIYALSPNVILWSLTISTEVSFALMLALVTLLTVRAVNSYRRWWPLALGLGLGGLAYLRPIAIALALPSGAVVYWFRRTRYGKPRALLSAVLLVVMVALAVVPWAYGNWLAYGEMTFSSAPRTHWIGSSLTQVVAKAEAISTDEAMDRLDSSRGSIALTVEVMSNYPTEFVEVQLLGLLRTLAGSDPAAWGSVTGADSLVGRALLAGASLSRPDRLLEALLQGENSTHWFGLAVQAIGLAYSAVLLVPAAFGAAFARLESDAGKLFRIVAMSNALLLVLLPGGAGQAQFRVPAEPYLAMLAGLGVSLVVDRWLLWSRRRQARRETAALPN